MRATSIFISFLVLSLAIPGDVLACSSFTLKADDVLICGRNVDGPEPMTGIVAVNNRGVHKSGRSMQWLFCGDEPACAETGAGFGLWSVDAGHPPMSWVSKYGSITFNYQGLEFPDGGMNEAGLVFQEMTMLKTEYPSDDAKAGIFMVLWIQYIIDTCATVDEVITSARSVAIDGWSWHFFAADAAGNSAVIEFLDGKAVIHTGEALPHAVLCNSTYTDELGLLDEYEGFGGTTPLDTEKQEIDGRFAKGVTLLGRYSATTQVSPMAYAWGILDAMSPGFTQSAQVYDVTNRRIEFRTSLATKIKSISFSDFDFGCDRPAMVLDLNTDLEGDVSAKLEAYTVVNNSRTVSENFLKFSRHPEFMGFEAATGVSLESIVARFIEHPGTTSCEVVENTQVSEE